MVPYFAFAERHSTRDGPQSGTIDNLILHFLKTGLSGVLKGRAQAKGRRQCPTVISTFGYKHHRE
jgi:hypothetical protein